MSRPFQRITLAQVARYPRPGMAVPGSIGFTPDGEQVTWLQSAEGSLVRSLWAYDIEAGERRLVAGPPPGSDDEASLSLEEELRRERARQRETGVTSYQYAEKADPPVLLVPMAGQLYVQTGAGQLEVLPATEGALDARLSPDGRRVAFVRGGELWAMDVAGGETIQLTSGAEPGLTNGAAEFIAAEELDRDEGYWWDPTSSRLAFVRADSRHVPVYPIVHQGRQAVEVEEHRYPFAGEANAYLQLGVVDVAIGATRWMDLGAERDIYLARVAWRPDGVLVVLVLARDQKSLRWLAFESDGTPTVLLEERGDPWLNLDHDTRFLESGLMLRSSERTGYRHLYLHNADGSLLRQLTAGEWVVTRLVGVDEAQETVFFQGTNEGVLERQVYAVSFDGGELRRVTESAGWHDAVFAKDGSRFVDLASSLEHAPTATLRTASGDKLTVLFANQGHTAEELGLRPPRLVEMPVEGTTLQGAIYEPPGSQPGRRHPVVVAVYGGPHAQMVASQWALTADLRAQYLAQEGFVVFKLDNRGSANRGLAFEAALDRRMGTVEVEDQAAGVRWLASQPNVDGERAGIFGWSYGGYMACLALMKAPEVFRVAVAGAPVADWAGYDTGYTERYMGTPQDNPKGYREASVLTHVEKLRGKLLIMHGMVDENVHFRHTGRLVAALAAAQKEYDLVLFPEERHMPRDAAGLEYQERRLVEYFKAHL